MTAMPARCSRPERGPDRMMTVLSVTRALLANPFRSFICGWNWKAGLLSGIFRAALFAIAVVRPSEAVRDPAGLGGIALQLAFRIAVGGIWGTVAQAFQEAEPAWLAALWSAAVLPAAVHLVEYFVLRANHVAHLEAGMIASISLSVLSLLLNWRLMRKGLLLTGKGSDSLVNDFSRLPAAFRDFVLAGPRLVVRAFRGCLA